MVEKKSYEYGGTCDKFKKPFPPENDVFLFDQLRKAGGYPFSSRHLLPTPDCQGSPSRAQYLQGQLRDARGFAYIPAREEPFRAAYKIMQDAFQEGRGDDLIRDVIELAQSARGNASS